MQEQRGYSSMRRIKQFLPAVIIAVLLAGCAQEKAAPAAQTTATPSAVPAWRQVETVLSQALIGTPDGKCEWEVWGWREQERYLWALCQAGAGFDAAAASLPLVLREASENVVEVAAIPDEGSDYDLSVKRLFPPAVQEKSRPMISTSARHPFTCWSAGTTRPCRRQFLPEPTIRCPPAVLLPFRR